MLMNYVLIGFIVSWLSIIGRYVSGVTTHVMDESISDIKHGVCVEIYLIVWLLSFLANMIFWPLVVISSTAEIIYFIKTGKRVF